MNYDNNEFVGMHKPQQPPQQYLQQYPQQDPQQYLQQNPQQDPQQYLQQNTQQYPRYYRNLLQYESQPYSEHEVLGMNSCEFCCLIFIVVILISCTSVWWL